MPSNGDKIIGWNSPILIHPGEHLLDFIEDAGISQAELAERVGISKKAINEIVKGKASITQQTAFRLSKVFAVSPDFWISLQSNYDLGVAREREEKRIVKDTEHLADFHCAYKELERVRAVPPIRWVKKNYEIITANLQRFFAVDSLAYVPSTTLGTAWRKYERKHLDRYALAAWLRLGTTKAQSTAVQPFDAERLRGKLETLKGLSLLSVQEYLPRLEQELADCGIVLVLAPGFAHTYAQGATHWIQKDKVVLMLNTTKKDEGKFWFTLFHELGHILLHGKKEAIVEIENGVEETDIEREADRFAQQQLIPDFKNTMQACMSTRGSPVEAVRAAAHNAGVSPAILAGRITHEYKDENINIYKAMAPLLKGRIEAVNIVTV